MKNNESPGSDGIPVYIPLRTKHEMEMTSFSQRMFIKISQEIKINGWIPEKCTVQ